MLQQKDIEIYELSRENDYLKERTGSSHPNTTSEGFRQDSA